MSVLSDSDCQQQIINTCILIKNKLLSKVKDDELKKCWFNPKNSYPITPSQNIRCFNIFKL